MSSSSEVQALAQPPPPPVSKDDDTKSEISSVDENDETKQKTIQDRLKEIDWKQLAISAGNYVVSLFKKHPTRILLARYRDSEGNLERALSNLLCTFEEKTYLCSMWLQIDEDANNKMSYKEFCFFFSIQPDEYASRVFLIMNSSLTGVVNLAEFLTFCSMYLVVDKNMTKQFSFRMLSRRASTELTIHSVMGIDDFKIFTASRYGGPDSAKLATKIFCYLDKDGDGGMDIEEWVEFCEKNYTFVSFFHKILNHLRMCIFGLDFWVLRTRKLKKRAATGINRLMRTSRINVDSEQYCEILGDPVVDKRGKTIHTGDYVPTEAELLEAAAKLAAETKEKQVIF